MQNLLGNAGVVPVVKIENAEDAVPMAKALESGGLSVVEVTFRTQAAAAAIEKISHALPEMILLAGTVLTMEQAQLAIACGADGVVTPGTNPEVVKWCQYQRVPVCPGCATPTEVESALSMSLSLVKLFPAEVVGGVNMLKALQGPYSRVSFMPTGGITLQNAADYLKLPNVAAVGGTWICTGDLLAEKDFATIEQNAKEAAAIVKAVRG